MDPVTALAAASTAFGLIKKGFAAGRDIESMYERCCCNAMSLCRYDRVLRQLFEIPAYQTAETIINLVCVYGPDERAMFA